MGSSGSNMSEAHELFVVCGMTTTGPAPHYGCIRGILH